MLSTPFSINNVTIKNRFLRSATMENMADKDGYVSDALLTMYYQLAMGQTGLIISGAAAVEETGKLWPQQLALWDDQYIDGLQKLANVIHRYGEGCKCAVQLHHCGDTGYGYSYGGKNGRFSLNEASDNEIKQTIKAFGDAARRVKMAGFDAVAVHAGHGYLISQFLSPVTNQRTDLWGGNQERRVRFAREVCTAIRAEVGDDMPLLWKMNSADFLEGGQGVVEYAAMSKKLVAAGIDLVEISGGMKNQIELRMHLRKLAGSKEAYFWDAIAPFRDAIGDCALAVTGGLRSLPAMQDLLSDGVDMIGLSRSLICEPDLPNRLLNSPNKTTAKCTSCNKCLLKIATEPLRCIEFDSIHPVPQML